MTPRHRTGARALLLLVTTVSLLAACGSSAVDKQGAPAAPSATELVLGTPDPSDAELAFFVDAVDRASNHRLKIRLDRTTYESETPGGEAKLVGDLRAGKVPLGYVPSRDLAQDGAAAFQALQAPFVVGSTGAAVALAGHPLANDLVASLSDSGLHGIALVPLESRRLLSRRPVASVADLEGTRIRVSDNAQAAGLMSAWSAVPVQGYPAGKTKSELTAGRLDAVETSPSYIRSNAYFASAPYLGSFGMFGKFEVVVAGEKAWAGLSDADRAALTSAATQTVTHAATQTPRSETETLSWLCSRGVVVVQPPDAALRELTTAAAKTLPADTAAQGWVTRIRGDLAAPLPPPAPDAAAGCPVATSAGQARSLHDKAAASASPTATPKPAANAFPLGTFEFMVTKQEWIAGGVDNDLSTADITFTFHFNPDGTFTESQVPDFPDQGSFEGTWKTDGDRLTTRGHSVLDPATEYVETTTWSYFRGELHFTVVDVADSSARVMYSKPWRKTG